MNTGPARSGLRLLCTYVLFAMQCPVGHATELDPAALRECSRILDDTERLACFDQVMGSEQGTELRAEKKVTQNGSDPKTEIEQYTPLNDEVGRETLGRREDVESGNPGVRGRIVRCQTDVNGKYFFYFDNGQVWKQTDGRHLTFDECNFEVTISKDLFGYKMQPLGERRKLRIARVK